jgi:ribosome maturation factor RimP
MTSPFFARAALDEIIASLASDPRFRDVEVLRSTIRREHGASVLDIVVDRADGVDTDLCEAVTKHVIRRVDALEQGIGDYRVEVSSAGLDRPLLSPAHFRRFAGRTAKVITTLRIANRTEFTGSIGAVTDESVTILDPHAGPTPVPYAAMKRANLVYDPAEDLKRKR